MQPTSARQHRKMSLLLRLKPLICTRFVSKTLKLNRRICLSAPRIALKPQFRSTNSSSGILKDNLSSDYELIYRAPMAQYIAVAKNVSLATIMMISLMAGIKVLSDSKYITVMSDVTFGGLVSQESDIWYFSVGFLAINLVILWFVSKYPLRIYKNIDKYVAVYDSQMPLRTTKHMFSKGDVTETRNVFNPWGGSMYRLGERKSLLLLDYFRTPSEFYLMCTSKK